MLTVHRVAAAVLLSSLPVCATVAQSEGPADFSFRALDGGSVTGADLRGKVAVLRDGRVEGKPLEGFGPKGSLLRHLRSRLARLTDGRRVITP